MTRFWRAKLALNFTSKVVPKAPPVGGFTSPIRLIGSPISQKLGFPNGACRSNQQHYNPFLGGAKRFYCVDRNQVLGGPRRWFQNLRNVTVLVLLGSGIVFTVYFGFQIVITVCFGCETVPYTKRSHFVLLSWDEEREYGEMHFDSMKKSFETDILPANHPESVRVRLIAKQIIEASHRGLQHDLGYASESVQSWKKGKSHSHLEGLDWEVIVVDKPTVYASCLPGGKIVVHAGMLKLFKTDAEVAVILGHELAHVVARHPAEKFTNESWVRSSQIILMLFIIAAIVNTISNILLRLPFSLPFFGRILLAISVWILAANGIGSVYLPRKMELEADYIGMLLLASAGYDPRVAPKFYQKFGDAVGDSALQNYLSDHPSGKKRAQLLSQAQVMQEALDIYMQAKLGRAGAQRQEKYCKLTIQQDET